MTKIALICLLILQSLVGYGQKLKLEKLEEVLGATLDKAEESLFLTGYSFLNRFDIADSAGVIYTFSNRKRTIGTAKVVRKGIYFKEPLRSFAQYTTYERDEFENFRRLMILQQFHRVDPNSLSENSEYRKDNLIVTFEVSADEYENICFNIILRFLKLPLKDGPLRKVSLKSLFKTRDE